VAPPDDACIGCEGACLFQQRNGCNPSKNIKLASCWYCAVSSRNKDPVAPEAACSCSEFSSECEVDKRECTFTEANANPECWSCAVPLGSCSHNCIVDEDTCRFFGGCQDPTNPECFYCKAARGPIKAPEGACADCDGPTSDDCIADDGCNPIELYNNPSCYSCAGGSGAGADAATTTTTTTRAPKAPKGRRGRRGRGN
jgi:hypothetical protein